MRTIKKPDFDERLVIQKCVDGVSDMATKARFNSISDDMHKAGLEYLAKARKSELFTIAANNSKNTAIVIGGISKKELNSLYTQYMVNQDKPARLIYETIKHSQTICPLCGYGQVKTVDHYLPKSKFPLYSVLTHNLVPACRDCNIEKLAGTADTASQQVFHPYFMDSCFINERWLSARIKDTSPACVTYLVSTPFGWAETTKNRAAAHFRSFKLGERFGVEAGKQFATLRSVLKYFKNTTDVRNSLKELLEDELKLHKNSWKSALYEALIGSEWYCSEGYKQLYE